MVFRFNPAESLSTGHTATQTLDPTFHSAVTVLSSTKSIMCGGNEKGDIFVFNSNFKGEYTLACKFTGSGNPVTAICCQIDCNTIFAGFLSGHIRIYRPNISEMSIEITAHVRSITGIIIDPKSEYFATCGEDQFFQVWQVPEFSSPNYVDSMKKNVLLFCEKIENRLCTGLAFLTENKIAVASYDDESLVVFQKNEK
jgi:WD40 repeat protein